MNSPKGSLIKDFIDNISVILSIFLLVRLKASYIPKISLITCLILEIAMKKTLKLKFGRRLQHNFNFFLTQYFFQVKQNCIPKMSILAFLIVDIAMKKTLKFKFGRRHQYNSNFFLSMPSSQVKIKLHTNNQPPSLLDYGDSYEEDLKIGIWKMTSKYFQIFSQYFSQLS